MSPVRALVALLGLIAAWAGSPRPAVPPESEAVRPPTAPAPGTALLSDLDRVHWRVRAHATYYAGRESWLDVGVSPLPPPRRLANR